MRIACAEVQISETETPLHLFAQQIMGLALQKSGITVADWSDWLERRPGLQGIDPSLLDQILDFMHATEILHADQGLFGIGQSGERQFGECLPQALRDMEIRMRYDCSAAFAVLRGQALEVLWIRGSAQSLAQRTGRS